MRGGLDRDAAQSWRGGNAGALARPPAGQTVVEDLHQGTGVGAIGGRWVMAGDPALQIEGGGLDPQAADLHRPIGKNTDGLGRQVEVVQALACTLNSFKTINYE